MVRSSSADNSSGSFGSLTGACACCYNRGDKAATAVGLPPLIPPTVSFSTMTSLSRLSARQRRGGCAALWGSRSVMVWLFLMGGVVRAAEPMPVIDEAFLFTPTGFQKPGEPAVVNDSEKGRVKITILDKQTGKPTFCRINVVGSDGNYYQPTQNYLTPWGLTGRWPKTGKGNREGKGPFRYYGRFFYSWGEATVDVPAGHVRVEVWKGYEYQPQSQLVSVAVGETRPIRI